MIAIQERSSIATPARRRKPPAEKLFASFHAMRVRYWNRVPERRHPDLRKDDLRPVRDHRAANTIASRRIAPVEIPIASRRC
jgi:hypothetical protein